MKEVLENFKDEQGNTKLTAEKIKGVLSKKWANCRKRDKRSKRGLDCLKLTGYCNSMYIGLPSVVVLDCLKLTGYCNVKAPHLKNL